MDYEIIATLGPSSETEETWLSMLSAGVSAFRINTSHLSLSQLHSWLGKIRAFLRAIGARPPVVLDLQGSKWRLGQFTAFELRDGEIVDLVYGVASHQPNVLPVPHPEFFKAAAVSAGEIILSDAKLCLSIEAIDQGIVKARVMRGGEILPGKGLTLASSKFRNEALNVKDQKIFEQTKNLDFIRYALSYVKDATEMARYREIFGASAYLIAKLERKPAMEAALEIAEIADELWVCRGDLGAELGEQAMAEAVYQFSPLVPKVSIPVIMAGQVLEHMTACSTPTRSEVCYLYETLMKGYRGFVLSDETAIGRYPVESCRSASLFRGQTVGRR